MGPCGQVSVSSCGRSLGLQPVVNGVQCNRRASLRIGDVDITYRGRDHGMAEDALHLGQVHARLEKIGSAAVPELMKTVEGNLSAACDVVNAVADCAAAETLTVATHQQSCFTKEAELLQLVMTQRQVSFQATQHHLRQRYAAYLPSDRRRRHSAAPTHRGAGPCHITSPES